MRIPSLLFSLLLPASAFAAVEVTQAPGGKVTVKMDGQPFTEFNTEGSSHVYFYPVYGPGGLRMTRSWPMESPAGEEHDHIHHRSLWYAHGKVNGVDYWSEQATSKNPKLPVGKIEHVKFLEVKGGDKEGVISSLNNWVAPDGGIPLTSIQTVRFLQTPATERIMDWEVTLIAGDKEVVMQETKEGTMALRVAESMRLKPTKENAAAGKPTGHLVNSEGIKDDEVWGKKAKWVDYYGPVEGKQMGIAMFDHPANPRHPTRWHARNYGLFAANPFCEYDMDKTQPKGAGDFTMKPGQKVTFRYRILIHEGDAEQAKVAARYDEYVARKDAVAGDK